MNKEIIIECMNIPDCRDYEIALNILGNAAISNGWAKNGYSEALINRERNFPTGLKTKTIGVAIPHADPDWVIKPTILVGILNQAVQFMRMDNFNEFVDVNIVFLISLPSEKGHIELLRNLVSMISDNNFLNFFFVKPDKKLLIDFLSQSTNQLRFI